MIPIGITQHVMKLRYVLANNQAILLTAVGATGTVATAYLAARASFKASDILDETQDILEKELEFPETHVEITRKDQVKLVWKEYIPAATVGTITIASIILGHRASSRKIAALGLAAGVSERALQEYREKVVEKLGERKETDIRDAIAQDRVNAHPIGTREVILAGTGEVLCFDMLTGRYFQSTIEEIKRAENTINYEMIHFMSVSLSKFYDEIGLPPTSYTDSVGWNLNNKFEVKFSTTMSSDGRPCIAVDFLNPPTHDYDNVWT